MNSIDCLSTFWNRCARWEGSTVARRPRAWTPASHAACASCARRFGLTLDALAAKSDVSRSTISLIERGESSPTAVVLDKIATGLGVPLATLFDDASAAADPVSRRADRTSWRDPQSGYLRRNISPPNFPSPIRIVEIVLPAGARIAYETGARDVAIHQQVWVQEGSIEVTRGQRHPSPGQGRLPGHAARRRHRVPQPHPQGRARRRRGRERAAPAPRR